MKRCPQCGKAYDDSFEACPDDKAPLIKIAASASDSLIGNVLAGRYRLVEKIGQGGMGAIYKAVHTKMDRICVIKLLASLSSDSEGALARFNREAKMASRIDNPHAVTIYDFGEAEGGTLYLAMEFIDGRPLSHVMSREKKLETGRVIHITSQIAQALAAAHLLGIVHRDLKPDNIMITSKGAERDYVKVLDFGIAKMVADDGTDHVTKTGFILGTPVYMSPEQITGEHLDARSDLYSLALIVYEMLSGRLPFEGDNPQAIMIKRVMTDPIPLRAVAPWISDSIEWAVMSALTRNRDSRPPGVEAFASALATASHGGTQVIDNRATSKLPDYGTEYATAEQSSYRGETSDKATSVDSAARTLAFESQSQPLNPPTSKSPQTASTNPQASAHQQANTAPAQPSQSPQQSFATQPQTQSQLDYATSADQALAQPHEVAVESTKRRSKSWTWMAVSGLTLIILAAIFYFVLKPSQSGFTLTVSGAPPGSQVFVNDVSRGVTSDDGKIKVIGLSPGQATVRISRDGFSDYSAAVTGEEGKEATLTASLLPKALDYNGAMALVPAGEFVMGSENGEDDEKPAHKITLPAYYIDKYEVTNAEYKKFCDATGRQPPRLAGRETYFESYPDSPVLGVSWDEAKAYAEWAGKRLPTEAEWEKAASWDPLSQKKRRWPWGDSPEPNRVKLNSDLPAPVTAFSEGQSAFGVYNMAGNAAEWVESFYQPYQGNQTANADFGTKYKVVRGGSFRNNELDAVRTTYRYNFTAVPDPRQPIVIGFRCAISADDPRLQKHLQARNR